MNFTLFASASLERHLSQTLVDYQIGMGRGITVDIGGSDPYRSWRNLRVAEALLRRFLIESYLMYLP